MTPAPICNDDVADRSGTAKQMKGQDIIRGDANLDQHVDDRNEEEILSSVSQEREADVGNSMNVTNSELRSTSTFELLRSETSNLFVDEEMTRASKSDSYSTLHSDFSPLSSSNFDLFGTRDENVFNREISTLFAPQSSERTESHFQAKSNEFLLNHAHKSRQIDSDEELARQLQEEENKMHRRKRKPRLRSVPSFFGYEPLPSELLSQFSEVKTDSTSQSHMSNNSLSSSTSWLCESLKKFASDVKTVASGLMNDGESNN